MRLDRGIWSDLSGDVAKEALVSELSAASMGAVLGLGVTMDASSERFLKKWIDDIGAQPQFIYEAVREASRAADCLGSVLGLDMAKGVDVCEILERQEKEKAEKAQKRKEERLSRRSDTGTVRIQQRSHSHRRL